MATENKISILISAVDEASKVLGKIWGSITDFAKKNEKAFTSMRNVWAVAFGAISAQAFSSISAFKESETQMVRVDQILKNMDYQGLKVSMEQAWQEARNFGDSLQNLSGIGWEQASESFAKLFQITKDVTQAQELATLSADLSIAKSIDMDSATKLVSMALAGNTRALKEYGIVLDENATPLQALEELQKRVWWQAEAYGKTLEGQQKILSESFWDMQESIGGALAPALSQLLASIQPVISSVVKWAWENPELVKNLILLGGAIAWLISVIGVLGLAIPAIVAWLSMITWPVLAIIAWVTALGIAWKENFLGIQDITYRVFNEIKAFWSVWWESILKGFENIWETIKMITSIAWEALWILFSDWFLILRGTFDIFKWLFTWNWSLMWEGIKTILSTVWNAMKWIITTIATEINTWVKTVFWVDIWATFSDIWNSVYNTAQTVFTSISTYITDKIDWIAKQLQKAKDSLHEIATLWIANTATFNWPKYATGWYFSWNKPIMVWENWPEILMPAWSWRIVPNNQIWGGQSINISFWDVTLSNGIELDMLTDKIKSVIYNEHKYARLWY